MISRLLIVLLFVAPIVAFLFVLNGDVGLVPLVGMDGQCAKCDRKATRTLPSAASALNGKGIYIYDRKRYSKVPVWCDSHGPDPFPENAGRAYASGIAVFAIAVADYRRIAAGQD